MIIYIRFMLKSPNNPWNPRIPNLLPYDVVELMKEEYYEIIIVVIELFWIMLLSLCNVVILDLLMEYDLWSLKGKVWELCMIMRVMYML